MTRTRHSVQLRCGVTPFALITMLCVALAPHRLAAQALQAEAPARDSGLIDAADLSRLAEIGDPNTVQWHARPTSPVVSSPDGRRTAVVVRGGDPDSGANVSKLFLLRRPHESSQYLVTEITQQASTTIYQPIALVRWLGNDGVMWVGSRGDNHPQVFTMRLGETSRAASFEETPVISYDVSVDTRFLFTLAERAPLRGQCRILPCRAVEPGYWALLEERATGSQTAAVYDLHSGERVALPPPESIDPRIAECDTQSFPLASISPDGGYVLRTCQLHDRPEEWTKYPPSRLEAACPSTCSQALIVYDRRGRTYSRLLNGPFNPYPLNSARPLWVGPHTLLVPFSPVRTRNGWRRAALTVDVATRQTHVVHRFPENVSWLTSVAWDSRRATLTVAWETEEGARKTLNFSKTSSSWQQMSAAPVEMPSEFAVKQSLNDRPVLVAYDAKTGAMEEVLDPNPWLAGRRLGEVRVVRWLHPNGDTWEGGLFLPPTYDSNARYPLVIQTHGFNAERFTLTGYANNFVAQALASRGIVVLQVAERIRKQIGTIAELETQQRGYEAAIDHLDHAGVIDANEVGLIGWSATGSPVGRMLTHSHSPIAAAALTESADLGWLWYTLNGASQISEGMHGGMPYGPSLATWLENAPTFNLDRVRAPLLISNAANAVSDWDWYAGLRRLARPVDLWWSADGTHDVYVVPQRIAYNQLLIDWFCFWLHDEERAVVSSYGGETKETLTARYSRWRELRKLQNDVLKQPRPPLLKWLSTPSSGDAAH